MSETLRREAFSISASEGMVLVEAPGVVATLDVEAASLLSDLLLAACGFARLQQHRAISGAQATGPTSAS
ncbi:MAG: hypothetical protein EOO77_29605 [Oxalobacteraceae bacterium]|nr:MAG: hypothetical protein EOO77_29605 [Oxalobacteraceae bacterium]